MESNVSVHVLGRHWWMLALRGVLAILFGLVALFLPGIALLAFILVFASYAIIDGITAAFVALRERRFLKRWGWVLVEGILSVVAGVLAFVYPGITALVLLYIVAAWAILSGILELMTALFLRGDHYREWALALAGVLSLFFGLVLFFFPGAGLLSLLWLVGIYSILFGVLFIVRAFQLRSWSLAATT